MTICHDFVEAGKEVEELLNKYLSTSDPSHLLKAKDRLQVFFGALEFEMQNPSLQETQVNVLGNWDLGGIEHAVKRSNALVLENSDYTATGEILENKLILLNVLADDDVQILARVTAVTPDRLILAMVPQ